jgi:hypothetical protein
VRGSALTHVCVGQAQDTNYQSPRTARIILLRRPRLQLAGPQALWAKSYCSSGADRAVSAWDSYLTYAVLTNHGAGAETGRTLRLLFRVALFQSVSPRCTLRRQFPSAADLLRTRCHNGGRRRRRALPVLAPHLRPRGVLGIFATRRRL